MTELAQPQPVTPELRQWIIDQARAGEQPESVLQSMMASGWREDVAIAALEDTLRGFLDERAKVAQLPPAVPVPDPLPAIAGIPTTLPAGDREVRVVLAMRDPRVIVFGGLLSHEECGERWCRWHAWSRQPPRLGAAKSWRCCRPPARRNW